MNEADRLAEAVRLYIYAERELDHREIDRAMILMEEALSAYEAREVPTLGQLAGACNYVWHSEAERNYVKDTAAIIPWLEVARTAAKELGVKLREE